MFSATNTAAVWDGALGVIGDSFSGVLSIVGYLITNLWPIMIGVFVLFGVIGFIWIKAKGIGR